MSINPFDDDVRRGQRVEGWGAVVEPGVRDFDVAEARSEIAIAAPLRAGPPPGRGFPELPGAGQPLPTPAAEDGRRRRHRKRGSVIFRAVRRLWIPLLILVVMGAGVMTVSRLHGIFGSEKRAPYADTQVNDTKPFDPKQMTYEVFGPPGTVADISYFDVNANPQRVEGAHLPWSLTLATTEATAVGDVVAQGDSDSIGCRIVVDGVVKAERITHDVSAFTFCTLKAS